MNNVTEAYPTPVLHKPSYLIQGLNRHIHVLQGKADTAHSVGTKGVSHNHRLSFDDNKVLKLSIGYAKHLFKCTGP